MKRSTPFQFTVRWGILSLLVIISAGLPQTASLPPITAILQPELRQLISSAPETIVTVIIQKKAPGSSLEQRLAQLDGKVTKDLPIINAVVAKLPARHVIQLAQDVGVRWVSLDGPVVKTTCESCSSTDNLLNTYNQAVRANEVWHEAPYRQGQAVTVAVVDSGIHKWHGDFGNRVKQSVNIAYPDLIFDGYGHGTYVAGIIAGDGARSQGSYVGVAPKANLIDVRVTSFAGAATESDVVAGLQWIYDNRAAHNIRVVNLSFNAATPQSYHTSPLNAASEVLWFDGIVVVAAAGNHGSGALYPPANDPFIITVGATDDQGTTAIADDLVASFSAYGVTTDGVVKPDLVAPGRNLVGPLNSKFGMLSLLRPRNVLNDTPYFRMSGTSAAAPVVTGAVALLLQAEPHLTPDQVKYRLMATANKGWSGYDRAKAGAGYVDIYAALKTKTIASANTGVPLSKLLLANPTTGSPAKMMWDSVSWSSVSWSSVSWSSVSWSSVSWSSDYWELDGGSTRANAPTLTAAELDLLIKENSPKTMIFLPVIVTEAE
ncbi:MAG: peptidase S8 [Caldilinea sp. CFX5]|nr:peptidase S8 [Caldilinea sp. CFX5]